MQRLFSNFANGWPGAGLLLQRGLAGSVLLYSGLGHMRERPVAWSMIPDALGASAALLLLVGLWTPVAGIVALLVRLWTFFAGVHEPLTAAISAMLSVTIAMIGPGAWSIDARIFGRKHIESPLPPKSSSDGLY